VTQYQLQTLFGIDGDDYKWLVSNEVTVFKKYVEVHVKFHSFLTSVLGGDECSVTF